jgi:hypothetical protein
MSRIGILLVINKRWRESGEMVRRRNVRTSPCSFEVAEDQVSYTGSKQQER